MERTKTALANYERYQTATATKLSDVYGSYSRFKSEAYARCVAMMYKLGGSNLKIVSHNCNVFSVGFEFPDPETGELCFAYITRDHDRYYPI